MTCRDRRDDILLYAAGALSKTPAAELRSHLQTCAKCSGFLNETKDDLAQLSLLLPAEEPPRRLKTALLSRITRPQSTPQRETRYVRTAVWSALAGVAATTLFVHFLIGRPLRNEVAALRVEQRQQEEHIQELVGRVQFASERKSELQLPHLEYVDLKPRNPNGGETAYALIDTMNQQLHFYSFDLPEVDSGFYSLWVQPIAADPRFIRNLRPNARGQATTLVEIQNFPLIESVSVTLEDVESPASMSENVVLHSTVTKQP